MIPKIDAFMFLTVHAMLCVISYLITCYLGLNWCAILREYLALIAAETNSLFDLYVILCKFNRFLANLIILIESNILLDDLRKYFSWSIHE